MILDRRTYRTLLWTGAAGLLGALLVGTGEFTMQFSPLGGYEEDGYRYFANVSRSRLTLGHFFSAYAAPLYLLGYWHLGQMFILGGSRVAGWVITLTGGYAFVVGNAWLGGRIYLALTAHEIAAEVDPETISQLSALLADFGAHNEPLVNVLRAAMGIISVLWIWRVSGGKTRYPKWMAIFSPGVLLGLIFAIYFTIPALGVWLLPAAMNVVHVIVFGLSVVVLTRSRGKTG